MKVSCIYCGSENTLPFEEEHEIKSDPSLIIIIIAALSLLAVYFAFIITSYLYFPVIVFIAIIISSKIVSRKEKKKTHIVSEKNFICLSCNRNFSRFL